MRSQRLRCPSRVRDIADIGCHARLVRRGTCVDYALAGGDDYEIIFTVSPAMRAPFQCAGDARIGVMTSRSRGRMHARR